MREQDGGAPASWASSAHAIGTAGSEGVPPSPSFFSAFLFCPGIIITPSPIRLQQQEWCTGLGQALLYLSPVWVLGQLVACQWGQDLMCAAAPRGVRYVKGHWEGALDPHPRRPAHMLTCTCWGHCHHYA